MIRIPVRKLGYAERSRIQALNWAQGHVYHNNIDDECTPDFSCCQTDLFTTNTAERWRYYSKRYGKGEPSAERKN